MMLVTTSKQRGVNRLQEKGTYRMKGGAGGILGMYPAGTGEIGKIQDLSEFAAGSEGVEQWCQSQSIDQRTSDFSEAHRAKTTAYEHAMYMRNISEWAVSMGFAPLVEAAVSGPTVSYGVLEIGVWRSPALIS